MQAQKEFGLIVLPQRFVFLLYFDDALDFFYVTFQVIFWNNLADFLCYFSLKGKNHAKSY